MAQQLKDRNVIFFGAPETLRDIAEKIGVRPLARLLDTSPSQLYAYRTRRTWPGVGLIVRIHDVTTQLAREQRIPEAWIITAGDWADAWRKSAEWEASKVADGLC